MNKWTLRTYYTTGDEYNDLSLSVMTALKGIIVKLSQGSTPALLTGCSLPYIFN